MHNTTTNLVIKLAENTFGISDYFKGVPFDPHSPKPYGAAGYYMGGQITDAALGKQTNTDGPLQMHGRNLSNYLGRPEVLAQMREGRKDPQLYGDLQNDFFEQSMGEGNIPAWMTPFMGGDIDLNNMDYIQLGELVSQFPEPMQANLRKIYDDGGMPAISNAIKNFRQGINRSFTEREPEFRARYTPLVLKQLVENKASGLMDFFKQIGSSMGTGVGNLWEYLLGLLKNISAPFRKMWDDLGKIKNQNHQVAVDTLQNDNTNGTT